MGSGKSEGNRCRFIERGLAIAPRSFDLCCRSYDLPELVVAPFSSGRDTVPIDTLLERRQAMRERFDTGAMPSYCRTCPHCETGEWEDPTHSVMLLYPKHHTLCQLRCVYCYTTREEPGSAGEGGRSPLSPLAAIRALLDGGHMDPAARVSWGGGENTLLSDFDEIFSLLLRYGCRQNVSSNAVVYSDVLGDSLAAGSSTLTCSLDAGTKEMYRIVKGRDYLERVLENLRRYYDRSTGKRSIRLKYVIHPENMGAADIEAFLALCSSFSGARVIMDIDQDISPDIVVPAVRELGEALRRHCDPDVLMIAGHNLRGAAMHAGIGAELDSLPLNRPGGASEKKYRRSLSL